MSRIRLTQKIIEKAVYKSGNGKKYPTDIRWDSYIGGLGLRLLPSGKKRFVFGYKVNNSWKVITLGAYPGISLHQAQTLALQHKAVIAEGKDPIEEKRRQQKKLMVDLCHDFLENHSKVHKKSWKKDESRINQRILPLLGRKPVDKVSRADIAQLHRKIGSKTPYEANRLQELLRKMFNYAILIGYLPEGSVNPASGIQRFKEIKRERWVTPEELPRLFKALNEYDRLYNVSAELTIHSYVRYAILLYLLTGLRKMELLQSKWEDINWDNRTLTIRTTKSGRQHTVPLSTSALKILKEIPKKEASPFILPGDKPGRHLVNIDKAWVKIKNLAGLQDVKLHDLRRTFGSLLVNSGHSLYIIQHLLNHQSPVTTQIYSRLLLDPKREAVETISRLLENHL